MRHLTRKRLRPAARAAAALGLAAALAANGGTAAWADAEAGGALGGSLGGGMAGGVGGIAPGSEGGGGSLGSGTGGPGSGIGHVDQPFGQVIRIIPDVGMSALLYLPPLPVDPYCRDEDTGHPGLQVLYVDRAYADEPGNWERWGTFEWDEDWQEYASGADSISPVFDDNYQDPTILYCTVSYSSKAVDYRDFYLRATAVTREYGVLTTTEFEPALIAYEGGWRPDDPDDSDDEPPTIVNPPEAGAGDSGGNRGGAVQGESERVDPGSTPKSLLPNMERAQAASGSEANGEGAGSDAEKHEAAESEGREERTGASSAGGNGAQTGGYRSAPDDGAPPHGNDQIPGFAWALGITVGTVGIAGGALAVLRAKGSLAKKRP